MLVRYWRIKMLSNYAAPDTATRQYGTQLYTGTVFVGKAEWLAPVVESGAAEIIEEFDRECD